MVVVAAVAFLFGEQSEKARLQEAIKETSVNLSPELAALVNEAGEVAGTLLERHPYNAEALAVAARLYERLGRSETSIATWRKCIELDPSQSAAWHEAVATIALEKGDKGDQEQAAVHFRLAMEQDPSSSVYPAQLAEVLTLQGKLEEAVELLHKNIELRPRSVASVVLLGQAYLQLREYEKARQYLEAGVEWGPNYTNAYYGLATACAKLGDEEKSKEYLEKFKALQAKDEQRHRDFLKADDDAADFAAITAAVYSGAAKVYIAHGDVHTGEDYLHKAVKLAPHVAEPRSVLAWLYEQQGRADEALRMLAELAEKAPDDLAAQMSLGAAYTRLQRFAEAEKAYLRATELTPHQPGCYVALADLYLQAGRKLPQAKALALKAADMEPRAENYFLLSIACQKNLDAPGALAAIEKAISLEPDNQEYRRAREMMRGQWRQ